MENGWNLLMPFLDDSPSFCHGYECGKIMEKMYGRQVIHTMIHAVNQKQIEMMAEITQYEVEFVPAGNEWLNLNAQPKNNEGVQAPK